MDPGRGRDASSLLDARASSLGLRSPIRRSSRSIASPAGTGAACSRPFRFRSDSPVYTSHAEASAYARWKGRRLMTEAEWHRAAEGSTTGHFDFAGFDPIPVGSHPPSAAGVYDLVGNGWEWTSTVFGPFDGFAPMRSYPGVLRRLLRRPPLRHERARRRRPRASWCARVSATGSEATILMSTRSSEQLGVDFAADVRRDLALAPKQLQSKYLYDALGSSLFEAICRLPWYRITRAERRAARSATRRRSSSACAPTRARCR